MNEDRCFEALRWTAILERFDRLGVTTGADESRSPSDSSSRRIDVRRFVDLRGLCGRLIADSSGAVTSAEV